MTTVPHSSAPSRSPPLRLKDLPRDVLLLICDFIHPSALYPLSQASPFWTSFLLSVVWPRRVASTIGVHSLRQDVSNFPSPLPPLLCANSPDCIAWPRIFHVFVSHASSRVLHICLHLSRADSVTSLALEFGLSRHDIFRANSLFNEHHLASRTHLYVPLPDEDAVLRFTGTPTARHTPFLVRDAVLSNKYFLVVQFRPSKDAHPSPTKDAAVAKRESYVRQLVVKLIAKGLSVDEDEVRFYLDDSNFDVARAYKQLLRDHNFSP